MDDNFELPVTHNGKEYSFPAQFLRTGYSYKVQVEVNGQVIFFEPDEERAWRALIDPEQAVRTHLSPALLQSIAETLDEVFRS